MINKNLITLKEAEELTGYKASSINKWIIKGKIKSIKTKNQHFIAKDELLNFIKTSGVKKPFKQFKKESEPTPKEEPKKDSNEEPKVEYNPLQLLSYVDEVIDSVLEKLAKELASNLNTNKYSPIEYILYTKSTDSMIKYSESLKEDIEGLKEEKK